MRKSTLFACVAIVVACCVLVPAQDAPQKQTNFHSQHAKTVRVSGKVSGDARLFADDSSQKLWVLTNSEMLKGFEGQSVVLRGRVGTESNQLHVLRVERQVSYTANWGDSAFRR